MKLLAASVTVIIIALDVVYPKYIDDDDPVYTSMDPAVREPRPCEVCKYLVTELKLRLEKSGRSKEVLNIGRGPDLSSRKNIKYHKSELRLTEALHEPHICGDILEYNVHAEREGSNRYARGQSETMSTLEGLVNKGVKVDLGIPHELWKEPSAEITKMHRMCILLVEEYEEDIEDWYYNHEGQNLSDFICKDRYLHKKNANPKCLKEVYVPKKNDIKGESTSTDPDSANPDIKKKQRKSNKSKRGDTQQRKEL